MQDYSSAKIELLALKWSVCEKFKDYLLGSKFTIYTDNNPLVYVKTSKLGAAQIRWLSELALYDFDIIYRTGKSNLVADALSRQPESSSSNSGGKEDNSDEEWEAISYPITNIRKFYGDHNTISSEVISQELTGLIGGVKISHDLKERIEMMGTAYEDMGGGELLSVQSNVVELFSHITPEQMAEFQGSDNQIGPVLQWIKDGKFPSKSILYRIKSKATRKLFHQLDRLALKQGVLHRLYINEDMEYHQLVLPQRLQGRVLRSVHDDMGHQGLERTLELLRERVYWPMMANDAAQWVSHCTCCQVAQGDLHRS